MGWAVALNNLLTHVSVESCPPHLMVLEYKMRMQIEPDTEACQEIPWLQSTGGISSPPLSLVLEDRFQRDFPREAELAYSHCASRKAEKPLLRLSRQGWCIK